MRRFLGAFVALALVAATAPPAAWAQFSEVVSAGAAASAPAGASGAAVLSAVPQAVGLGIAPLGAPALSVLPAANAPLMAPGLRPFEFSPHAVRAALPARTAVAPAAPVASAPSVAAAAPASDAPASAGEARAAKIVRLSAPAADARPSARAGLLAAGADFAAAAERPSETLERLFSGARTRALLSAPAVDVRPTATAPAPPDLRGGEGSSLAAPTAVRVAVAAVPAPAVAPAAVPVASPAAAGAQAAAPGFFGRTWARIKGLTRVLPDPQRNRAFWYFTLGQAIVTLGFNFHYTALPGLIAPNKSDTGKLTDNRAVNWGAQAASSLMTGPLVDRQPVKRTVVWGYLGRGVLIALIPILFVTGHFGFAAFSLIIGAAGFVQSTTINAASVAFNRILGDDDSYYNRANAISTIVTDAVGVVAPLMAGGFIAWIGSMFATPLMGNALAYGVFAVTLLLVGAGYAARLVLPRDEMLEARRGLQDQLKKTDLGGAKVKGVSAGTVDGKPGLLVEVSGVDAASVKGLPAQYQGYPVQAIPARSAVREMIAGFRLCFSDRFLRLYLLTTTVAVASGDALTFAVLTRYLNDVLHAGAGAFGIFLAASSLGLAVSSGLMTLLKDPAQSALKPAAAAFRASVAAGDAPPDAAALSRAAAALRQALPETLERYKAEWRKNSTLIRTPDALAADVLAEAAAPVGAALKISPAQAAALLESTGASKDVRLWAASKGARLLASAQKDAKTGMDSLQRQGRWSAYAQAASWVVYAGMFFAGSLHLSIGLMLLSSLLAGAESIIWSSLSTRVIAGSYPQDQGKVYSAMSFYWLACSVVGVLLFGWLLTSIATPTALLVTAVVLGVSALFSLFQGWRSFPLARR